MKAIVVGFIRSPQSHQRSRSGRCGETRHPSPARGRACALCGGHRALLGAREYKGRANHVRLGCTADILRSVLQLTADERAWLAGEAGPALRLAMRLIVHAARNARAARL